MSLRAVFIHSALRGEFLRESQVDSIMLVSEPVSSVERPSAAAGTLRPVTVAVPGGRFRLASHGAAISIGPFLLGRTPVTNREYAPFLASGRAAAPPWWTDPRFSLPLQPVVGITWGEAADYCMWLSEQTGGRWRLPTETEWEFAMCGGLCSPA